MKNFKKHAEGWQKHAVVGHNFTDNWTPNFWRRFILKSQYQICTGLILKKWPLHSEFTKRTGL